MKINRSARVRAMGMILFGLLAAASAARAQQVQLRLLDTGSAATFQTGAYRVTAVLGATGGGAFLHLVRLGQARPRDEAALFQAVAAVPETFSLEPNYPNPFNPQTTLRFGLPEAAPVRLEVYDVLGRLVATLLDRDMPAGWHAVVFEADALPSGVYLSRLETGVFRQVRQMVLVR